MDVQSSAATTGIRFGGNATRTDSIRATVLDARRLVSGARLRADAELTFHSDTQMFRPDNASEGTLPLPPDHFHTPSSSTSPPHSLRKHPR